MSLTIETTSTQHVSVGLVHPGDSTGVTTHEQYGITIGTGATMIIVEGTGAELDAFAAHVQKIADRANVRKGLRLDS